MKTTAIAPANIAFIKYWGKQDEQLRLPLNDSISLNLSGAYTTTTVEFSSENKHDAVSLVDGQFSDKEIAKVVASLDRIRERAGIGHRARVVTKNSFPKGTGAASSASGFAALTVAGFAAAGVELSEKELSIYARIGSGSGCRSIPDGFVLWKKGTTSDDSYAYSLYSHEYWDIRDLLVVVDMTMKKVSTTEGMEQVRSSPFLDARLAAIPGKIARLQQSLERKDISAFGELIEAECINMHAVMMTQVPPLFYWNEATITIMASVRQWRAEGIPVYFTIDAGSNIHVICEGKDAVQINNLLKKLAGVVQIIHNRPSAGTHLIENHLF